MNRMKIKKAVVKFPGGKDVVFEIGCKSPFSFNKDCTVDNITINKSGKVNIFYSDGDITKSLSVHEVYFRANF